MGKALITALFAQTDDHFAKQTVGRPCFLFRESSVRSHRAACDSFRLARNLHFAEIGRIGLVGAFFGLKIALKAEVNGVLHHAVIFK